MRSISRSTIGTAVVGLALLTNWAAPVSADHGYWPESGVDPATVTAHQPRTEANALASSWGPTCESIDYDAGLDVYGLVLDSDYEVAVVLAIRGDGSAGPLGGPFGVTVFGRPRAGEFVWADADGDGRFLGRHEADAGALFVCPELTPPPTDGEIVAEGPPGGLGGLGGLGSIVVWTAGLWVSVVLALSWAGRRRDDKRAR